MWLLQFFVKKQSAAALNTRIGLRSKLSSKRQEERTLITFFKLVNYLLEKYANDDVIAETGNEIMSFTEPLNRISIDHPDLL